jgi:hypothetical protein
MALGLVVVAGVLLILNAGVDVAGAASAEPVALASAEQALRSNGTVSTGHVVVIFTGEKATVREISWTGSISSVAALRAAGFIVETDVGNPDAICSIDGDGCPADDCWCASNWWWQGTWDQDSDAWDSPYPPPLLDDGDAIGFRNSTDWGQPALPAPSYIAGLKAVEWLRPRQSADTGAYGNVGGTVETLFAVAANGWDPAQWRRATDAPSLLHYLYGYGAGYATKGGEAGKEAAALVAAESCWPVGAQKPQEFYDAATGEYAGQAINQAWAMLGVRALGHTIPVSAAEALKSMMTENGGWGWPGWGEDTDTTALAVRALIAAGESATSTHVVSGLNYIKSRQNPDGGFNAGWSSDTSNASTAGSILAILAAGQDPISGTWRVDSTHPISYLVNAQQEDGAYMYAGSPDEFETRQAAVALLGRTFSSDVADLPMCYGMSGRTVMPGASGPVTDVVVTAGLWNNAAIATVNDASGVYTVSVPETGTYTVTPEKSDCWFVPRVRSVPVAGPPGELTAVDDFVCGVPFYFPLVMRD